MTEQHTWTEHDENGASATKTACDLRVLVRWSDGTIGGYAVDGIPSASRLREELTCAGTVFSDRQAGEDFQPASTWAPAVREVFDVMHSALTRTARGNRGPFEGLRPVTARYGGGR